MNDNDRRLFSSLPTDSERRFMLTLQALHIGANGRWFVICLVIISIAAQDLFGATVFALCLGAIHLIEGLPFLQPSTRRILAALTYLTIVCRVIVLLLSLQP